MSVRAKIAAALQKRRYRTLVYLLISVLIYGFAFMVDVELLFYALALINLVGDFLSVFWTICYGPPSMNYTYPNSALLVGKIMVTLGLFIEIFIVAEFIIPYWKLQHKYRD
jgi:hypothetical protein